jgi:hypothetical protein
MWLRPVELLFFKRALVRLRYPFDLPMEELLPPLYPHLKTNS